MNVSLSTVLISLSVISEIFFLLDIQDITILTIFLNQSGIIKTKNVCLCYFCFLKLNNLTKSKSGTIKDLSFLTLLFLSIKEIVEYLNYNIVNEFLIKIIDSLAVLLILSSPKSNKQKRKFGKLSYFKWVVHWYLLIDFIRFLVQKRSDIREFIIEHAQSLSSTLMIIPLMLLFLIATTTYLKSKQKSFKFIDPALLVIINRKLYHFCMMWPTFYYRYDSDFTIILFTIVVAILVILDYSRNYCYEHLNIIFDIFFGSVLDVRESNNWFFAPILLVIGSFIPLLISYIISSLVHSSSKIKTTSIPLKFAGIYTTCIGDSFSALIPRLIETFIQKKNKITHKKTFINIFAFTTTCIISMLILESGEFNAMKIRKIFFLSLFSALVEYNTVNRVDNLWLPINSMILWDLLNNFNISY